MFGLKFSLLIVCVLCSILQHPTGDEARMVLEIVGYNFAEFGTILIGVGDTATVAEILNATIANETHPMVAGSSAAVVCAQSDAGTVGTERELYYKHRSIRCTVPPLYTQGVTAGARLPKGHVVVLAGQLSHPSNVVLFEQFNPTLKSDSVDPKLIPTAGGASLSLEGSFMGFTSEAMAGDLSITVGGQPCAPLFWTPRTDQLAPCPEGELQVGETVSIAQTCDSQRSSLQNAVLRCQTPLGMGAVQPIIVTRRRAPSPPIDIGFIRPTLSCIEGNDAALTLGAVTLGQAITDVSTSACESSTEGWPTAGNTVMILQSSNLGTGPRVMLRDTMLNASETLLVDPLTHTRVAFTLPEGQGRNIRVTTSHGAGGQTSTNDLVFHYGTPVISSSKVWSPMESEPSTPSVELVSSTAGGVYVRLSGRNFGFDPANPPTLWLEAATNHLVFGTRNVTTISWTHDSIVFEVPAGEGKDIPIYPVVGGQVPPENALFSYLPPEVHSLGPRSFPTTGNATATLIGDNFGFSPIIHFGGSSLPWDDERVWFHNRTHIVFTVPAGQGLSRLRVEVAGQFSHDEAGVASSPNLPPTAMRTWPEVVYQKPELTFVAVDTGLAKTAGCHGFEAPETQAARQAMLQSTDVTAYASPHETSVDVLQNKRYFSTEDWMARSRSQLCCQTQRVHIGGSNFGTATPRVAFTIQPSEASMNGLIPVEPSLAPNCSRVGTRCIERVCDDRVLTVAGAGPMLEPAGCVVNEACIESFSHDSIIVRGLSGYGNNVLVHVGVQDLNNGRATSSYDFTNEGSMSFEPPAIERVVRKPYNARGDELRIYGRNFGPEVELESDPFQIEALLRLEVVITPVIPNITTFGALCNVTSSMTNSNPIICNTVDQPAGMHALQLTVAGQTVTLDSEADRQKVSSTCLPDDWGLAGEHCLDCPEGATCPGGLVPIKSQPGFWRDSLVPGGEGYDSFCVRKEPQELRNRNQTCPLFVGCIPAEACAGENTCALGYEADFCAQCLKGEYYRVAGLCEPCPSNPAVRFIMFGFGIIIVAGGAYLMNRYKMNIGRLGV